MCSILWFKRCACVLVRTLEKLQEWKILKMLCMYEHNQNKYIAIAELLKFQTQSSSNAWVSASQKEELALRPVRMYLWSILSLKANFKRSVIKPISKWSSNAFWRNVLRRFLLLRRILRCSQESFLFCVSKTQLCEAAVQMKDVAWSRWVAIPSPTFQAVCVQINVKKNQIRRSISFSNRLHQHVCDSISMLLSRKLAKIRALSSWCPNSPLGSRKPRRSCRFGQKAQSEKQ